MTEPAEPTKKEIVAEVYQGVETPRVELHDGDSVSIKLRASQKTPESADYEPEEMMSISLESISIEMENQSFGMINATTGCASNRGGPSC